MRDASMGEAGGADALAVLFGFEPTEVERFRALLGEALRAAGVEPQAILGALSRGDSLGAALGLSDAALELLYARAHGWFGIGRIDRAEPLFRALCIADGRVADHWVGHGVCLRARDDVDGAEIAFRMAAMLRPDWALPCFHLASLAVRRRDDRGASAALDRFEALIDGETPPAMRNEASRLRAVLDGSSSR